MKVSILKIILYKIIFCAIAILLIGCNHGGQETIQTEKVEIEMTTNELEITEESKDEEKVTTEENSGNIITEESESEEETEGKVQIVEPQEELLGSSEFGWDNALMLHKISVAEAGGESVKSMALIMVVIMNRVESDIFPNSIEEVIFQKTNGVAQFSPIIDGNYDRAQPNEKSYQAMKLILEGWDESQGALYFEACKDGGAWHSTALEYLFEKDGIRYYK